MGERTYRIDARDGATEFSMTEEYTGLLAGVFTKAIPDLTERLSAKRVNDKSASEATVGQPAQSRPPGSRQTNLNVVHPAGGARVRSA
jgi:hypothetical protein